MNYFKQMQKLRDRAAKRASAFSVPSAWTLHRRVDGQEKFLIQPNPIIREISQLPEVFGEIRQTEGIVKKYRVEGISKCYKREELEYRNIDFLINDTIVCQLFEIIDQPISWNLILEQRIGDQTLPVNRYY